MDGVAGAAVGEGVGAGGGEEAEGVSGLVDADVWGVGWDGHGVGGGQDGLERGELIVFGEEGEVVVGGVVVCADLEECCEGVELVFAFVDGCVGVPCGYDVVGGGGAVDGAGDLGLGRLLKGIAIGV